MMKVFDFQPPGLIRHPIKKTNENITMAPENIENAWEILKMLQQTPTI